jgi:hypothetical protein
MIQIMLLCVKRGMCIMVVVQDFSSQQRPQLCVCQVKCVSVELLMVVFEKHVSNVGPTRTWPTLFRPDQDLV